MTPELVPKGDDIGEETAPGLMQEAIPTLSDTSAEAKAIRVRAAATLCDRLSDFDALNLISVGNHQWYGMNHKPPTPFYIQGTPISFRDIGGNKWPFAPGKGCKEVAGP